MASIKLSVASKGLNFQAGQDHQLILLTTRRVRLVGLFFDLSKCFLLPSALPGIRTVKKFYDEHSKAKLLVVGHTDTSGREAYNETLSLERAEAVAAYLTDDVAAWDAFFNEDKPAEKLWGTLEVQYMLAALPEKGPFFFKGKPSGMADGKHKEAVRAYQASKKDLKTDGIAGPLTRKALITDYMALDQTSLPAGITLTTHGCGENFPVDGVRDPDNRRVEIFFFDEAIDPAPPGKISKKGSTAYPKWLEEVSQTVDVGVNGLEAGSSIVIKVGRLFTDSDLGGVTCHIFGNRLDMTQVLDDSAEIEVKVPPGTVSLTLELLLEGEIIFSNSYPVAEIPPVNEMKGLKVRLNLLGFDAGEINDADEAQSRIAIKRFQQKSGLPMTGIADTETQNKLMLEFGA